MRIFQVLGAQATWGVKGSRIWLRNLHEPLLDLGHDVVLFPAEDGIRARAVNDSVLRERFSQKLLDAFRVEHSRKPFNLFFAYLMDGMVEPAVIDEIQKTGIPTCNFSCNNTHQFDLVDELSPHFDFSLHSEKDVDSKFKEVGATPVWFPMAANPSYYHPYDLPRSLDVVFVGQRYARRPHYLWHLLENGIDVHAYGPGWRLRGDGGWWRELLRRGSRTALAFRALTGSTPENRARLSARLAWLDLCERLRFKYDSNLHQPLSDEEMVHKYSESRISLGFLEVYAAHDPSAEVKVHLHLRDFEAPMSGALYLTGYCKELEEFYLPDEEVLVYRDEQEMLSKVRYYLTHPEAADRVREAGLRRAQRDHSYQQRFRKLFKQIGLEK